MMDKDRFSAIVAAYGAEPRRWPQDERAAAQAYADAHAEECAALLAQAHSIDAALASAPAHEPSELLAARVMQAHRAARARLLQSPRRTALALAACAAMGVLVGFGGAHLAPAAPSADDAEEMIAAVFGGGEDVFGLMGDGG